MLQQALLDFARQAHVQILLRGISPSHIRTTALRGRYTGRQVVDRLLSGTGLTYTVTDHAVEIFPEHHAINNAQASGVDPDANRPRRHAEEGSRHRAKHVSVAPPILEQVVVTGTHISGGPPPSEPIISITRRQIRESGYQSVEQLMDALPENFNSMGSEENNLHSETDAGNFGFGAAVDLMGLGYDSTLVLVNGHRLAPAGLNGAFTDISVIPLSAIKRIDIVTDGASAIYGADAIGGVVNYVLRNRQSGGETSLEYGSVTQGGLKDYRATQSYGLKWESGHALISYEYHDETPLNVVDREFSAAAAPGFLTPGLTQNSAYLTADQSMTSRWKLDADAFYSHRRNTDLGAIGGQPFWGHAESAQYSYAVGSSVLLPKDWTVRTRLSYGGNDTRLTTMDGSLSGDNTLSTASLVANGVVLNLPAGSFKGAVGIQARYEALADLYTGLYSLNDIHRHRTVESAFMEASVPLLPPLEDSRTPAASLDLAGRVDRYSDFGTSINPRAGIAWEPFAGVRLRGTISSSFKAPNFYQLYGAQYAALVNSPEPQLPAGETVAALYLSGSNPRLTAEKSTEWTAGVDVTPASLPGFSAHVTYYHVRFKHRIVDLGIPLLASLDQGSLYSPYIQRNPSFVQLENLAGTQYSYENITTLPGFGPARALSDAVAVVNDRFQNVGETRSSGLLTTVAYGGNAGEFRYNVSFNGAYIFEFTNRSVPGARAYSVLNTVNNPVNFRGRVTAQVNRAAWGITAALNYVNHYEDTITGHPVPVASWTTVNLTGSYRLFRGFTGAGHWGKTRLYVSCLNCFNRAPPPVRVISDYLGYDPTNANAIGRFISATVAVRW